MPYQQWAPPLVVAKGEILAHALSENHYPIRTDCGGLGTCGKCRVQILPGTALPLPTKAETSLLSESQLKSGIRLACQVKPDQPTVISLGMPPTAKPILICQVNPLANGSACTCAGVAIDLGTTCIDLFIWDLDQNALVVSAKGENDQRCHGHDVISRIFAAGSQGTGLARLQSLAVQTINRLLAVCLQTAGINPAAITRVALAGNTAMTLILAKINPESLGTYPYRPLITELPPSTAGALGLNMASKIPVYMFPLVAGFIGGDTVSALVAAADCLDPKKISLVLDIGTNGELVLLHGNRILATSCATGPAFEGAIISCGMPAGDAAIDHMAIDPVSGKFSWHVMGSKRGIKPEGVCGSGLVDALAELVRTGILSPGGLLDPNFDLVTKTDKNGFQIQLVPPDQTALGHPLTLSQKDIGEMQLAKAAICAGIELLLARSGITHVDHTIVTGAFGAGFNFSNAVAIGLLPQLLQKGKLTMAPGLAGRGASLALINSGTENRALELSRKINVLELGGDPRFQDRFIAAMAFPSGPIKGIS